MSNNDGWWNVFFSGAWRDIQRAATMGKTVPECDLIERLLRVKPGSRLLDVPCGAGRHSLELAARGYDVTGVDITESVLFDARDGAARSGLNVTFESRDMRDLPWLERFDGAFCYWGSFGYFDEEGDRAFLRSTARALKPGGSFLLETHCVETVLPRFEKQGSNDLGEMTLHEERRYDHTTGRVESFWRLDNGEIVWEGRSSIRLYTYREMAAMLVESGFVDPQGYDGLSGEPFGFGARRLAITASKEG